MRAKPQVKTVTGENPVVVTFNDGTEAQFFPNVAGFGNSDSAELFLLRRGKGELARFHSPSQQSVTRRPFGFVKVATDITQEEIIDYWRTAFSHVKAAAKRLYSQQWGVVFSFGDDLEEVEAGKWPLPRR